MTRQSPYLFRKRFLKLFVGFIDSVGNRFFYRKKINEIPQDLERIIVIRLDHIGDVVLSEPFLSALKFHRPGVDITFVTSQAGMKVFESLPGIGRTAAIHAGWFDKRFRPVQNFVDWIRFIKLLRHLDGNVVVDLRGDFRHILAARLAKPHALLLSYGVTGGAFLLDHEVKFNRESHASEHNMSFLRPLGVRKTWKEIRLSPFISACQLDPEFLRVLPSKKAKWVALHAGTGTKAKAWPQEAWQALVVKLALLTDYQIFWIGDNATQALVTRLVTALLKQQKRALRQRALKSGGADMDRMENANQRFMSLCERLPLESLGEFLKRCDLLISADSGPVHVASAHEVPTLVLYSGTNNPGEWGPLGSQANLMRHPVSCSPCYETRCPKPRHYCMEGINAIDVFEEALRMLGAAPQG